MVFRMNNSKVYLDNNATVPIRPEVVQAVNNIMTNVGNPSSVHYHGRKARRALEESRLNVAALCGAKPSCVTFTSGGTESNNLAIMGSGRKRILISSIEHPSVSAACQDPVVIPVNRNGIIDLTALSIALESDTTPALVSVMLANNETGVIQPISDISSIASRHGALVHCDAVQAVGKLEVDISQLGADFLSLSAHKIGGPAGCGALLTKDNHMYSAVLKGGGQELSLRSGTENLMGVAGFGVAAATVSKNWVRESKRMRYMRDYLEDSLLIRVSGIKIIGKNVERLANTTCLIVDGVSSSTLVMGLDLSGVSVSGGAACSSGKVSGSFVLQAMGYEKKLSASVLRISLGWLNTEEDVDRFVHEFEGVYKRLISRHDLVNKSDYIREVAENHADSPHYF